MTDSKKTTETTDSKSQVAEVKRPDVTWQGGAEGSVKVAHPKLPLDKSHPHYHLDTLNSEVFPASCKFTVWINAVAMPHLGNPKLAGLNCNTFHHSDLETMFPKPNRIQVGRRDSERPWTF